MAGELLQTMMAGNNNAAADPTMASITPELSLAQTLTQAGLSSAPASPMQASAALPK